METKTKEFIGVALLGGFVASLIASVGRGLSPITVVGFFLGMVSGVVGWQIGEITRRIWKRTKCKA